MFSVKNVSKNFKAKKVLQNVGLEINPGEIVALIGRNGAGKTTLIKCLNGMYRSEGEVILDNVNLKDSQETFLQKVGILLEPHFYDYLSAKQNLVCVGMLAGLDKKTSMEKAEKLLDFLSLSESKNMKVHQYSFGMKQRLGVAAALIHDPQLLILDEPTLGVDPKGIDLLIERIQYLAHEENKMILFSSNAMQDTERLADRALLLKDGVIKQLSDDVDLSQIAKEL